MNPPSEVSIGKGGGGVTDSWVVERRGGQHSGQRRRDRCHDRAAGADTFSLFVNQDLGSSAPTADAVNGFIDGGAIAGIGLFGSRGWPIDEIRLGDSLADVTLAAVPEPATWMQSLVGSLGLLGIRRRTA